MNAVSKAHQLRIIRKTKSTLVTLFTFLVVSIIMLPLLWMILLSFKTSNAIMTQPLSLPSALNFHNYYSALETLPLGLMYKNTFIVVLVSQAVTLIITFMSSFALSRLRFRSRKLRNSIYMFLLIGQMIPVYVLLFPIYMLNISFRLTDSYASLILPLIATNIAFDSLIFVGFLSDFPSEIEEAAIIDGCNLFVICTRIIMPIIKPAFATVIVFNVLYVWNEYPLSATLINKASMFTVSLGASMFRGQYSMNYGGLVAGTVLIVLPQLIFYALFQRHITDGLTAGAIKG